MEFTAESKLRAAGGCGGEGKEGTVLQRKRFSPPRASHSPGVQWQNLNPQCRIWLSVWHLFLRRYNFVNCWYFT